MKEKDSMVDAYRQWDDDKQRIVENELKMMGRES
jgi:hypothetical protein